jgi:ABC-type iron transport system FetAB ATPase subunit
MRQHKRIFIVDHSGAGKGVLAQTVASFSISLDDGDIDEHVASIIKCQGC